VAGAYRVSWSWGSQVGTTVPALRTHLAYSDFTLTARLQAWRFGLRRETHR
jgi:hypothetical protein